MRQYTWEQQQPIADKVAELSERFLNTLPQTERVVNVEKDPTFQEADIDLLWKNKSGNTYKIEIKGDNCFHTGNFFFETISNMNKGTQGCFMKTECDFMFYLFMPQQILFILPMPMTRDWFKLNIDKGKVKHLQNIGPNGEVWFETRGYVIPRKYIIKELSPIVIHLRDRLVEQTTA
jgi:hypothetical protein